MLHSLVEFALSRNLEVEPGFSPKIVKWALVFNLTGRFLETMPLCDSGDKKSKGHQFAKCPELRQPEIISVGDGCRPFLVDTLDVMTLFGEDALEVKVRPKLRAKHEFFVSLLNEASGVLPVLGRVSLALNDEATLSSIQANLSKAKARSKDKATISVVGHQPAHIVESEAWHEWWREWRRRRLGGKPGSKGAPQTVARRRCLISGELAVPTLTHPRIIGLVDVGGHTAGDALASFDKDAFASYGLEQSMNATTSPEMAAAYRAALNHLIQDTGERFGGAKVVHWFNRRVDAADDPFSFLIREESDQLDAKQRARTLLRAIQDGKRPDLANATYYALTLSGVAGRVMVRQWMEGQFEELLGNVLAWFADLSIGRRDGGGLAPAPKFAAVLGAMVRDLKDIHQPLAVAIWRCAVRRDAVPHEAMAQAIYRLKVDLIQGEQWSHARMGLLKAYHRRKGDAHMSEWLDRGHPDPAYHCGRLMGTLAALQEAALGRNIGAGVVQRYYAAASATPALMLGRLLRLAQFHVGKLRGESPGLAHWFESQIADILKAVRMRFPQTLALEKQSLFALGYYHQMADHRAGRKKDDEPKNGVASAEEG